MRHCVASGRGGAQRRHCWSTLAITHGKFGLLCGILQPWHAPSHLNEIIAQLPHCCCTVLHYITVLLLLPHSHRRAVSPRPPIYHYNNNKSSLWITGPFLTARFLLMSTKVSDLFSFGQRDRRAVAQCRVISYYVLGLAALLALVGFKGYFTVEFHRLWNCSQEICSYFFQSIHGTRQFVCRKRVSIEFLRPSDLKNSFKTRYFFGFWQ